jgi:hypothetical protein
MREKKENERSEERKKKMKDEKRSGRGWTSVITPFLPPGFSRVSARKTRQPESSRPVPTRAHHLKYSQKESPRHLSLGLTKFDWS